jgi:hypothetical protein
MWSIFNRKVKVSGTRHIQEAFCAAGVEGWSVRFMGKRAEYLEQARFCQQMAAKARTTERKAPWLELASKWVALADELADEVENPILAPARRQLKVVS